VVFINLHQALDDYPCCFIRFQSFADEQQRDEELERVRQMREVAAYQRERDFEVRTVRELEVKRAPVQTLVLCSSIVAVQQHSTVTQY